MHIRRICKRINKYYFPLDTVVALGKRNIPFRGHTWNKETKRKDRNFDFYINWKAKFDPVLKSHLSHCSKNVTGSEKTSNLAKNIQK